MAKNAICSKDFESWVDSRKIIADFLKKLRPDLSQADHDHNAAAIIARLAHNEPPLLISYVSLEPQQ